MFNLGGLVAQLKRQSKKMRAHLLWGLSLLCLFAGCDRKREVASGQGRVREVEYQKHWITLSLQPGARPEEVVAVALFHGLAPKTTHASATKLLGKPNNVRREDDNVYHEYYYSDARVEVGREQYSTGSEIGTSWSLAAFPQNLSFRDVLAPDAISSFKLRSPKSVIQIVDDRGDLQFIIVLSGSRVEKIGWLRR